MSLEPDATETALESSPPVHTGRTTPAPPAPAVTTSTPAWSSSAAFTGSSGDSTDARHWTVAELRRHEVAPGEVCDDAELIVSELVANAVLHGRPPVTLLLTRSPAHLHIAVTDTGPTPAGIGARAAAPTAAHGRGLTIVAALTAGWGVESHDPGPGTTVWGSLSAPS